MDDIEVEWEQLPIAELHQLDNVCDRFERAFAQDPETRIESFIVDLSPSQQRLIVRELVPLEIEQRLAAGVSPTPDDFASRFPQWRDELQSLAAQCLDDLERARILNSETDSGKSASDNTNPELTAPRRGERRRSTDFVSQPDLPADRVLGQYRLLSVVGRGGMGYVWRAHDTKLSRDVAIKVLAGTITHDEITHERFLREARAIAAIRHNHVVTIYAVEEFDQIPFLVMELVEGTTLQEYLRDYGKLEVKEATSLACQIAEGLAAAHRQGLIHRDVKPANILLEKDARDTNSSRSVTPWNVKITDFGLARIAAESQLTLSGVVAGTPQYMSPEQANGQEVDARSDLFSLGSVMYAMCAGQEAFRADSALAVLRQVVDKPARSLREVSPQTPDWLIEIIEKLMAKSPNDRIQTADEVAELLQQNLHDLPSSPCRPGSITPRQPAIPAPALRPLTQPEPAPAPRMGRQLSGPWKFAVALLMIAPIVFWVGQIVFRIETPHGTLIVKSDDPDVQISVKSGGTEVALFFPRQKKEIPLKVGAYTIELVEGREGLSLSTNKFEITSGEDQQTVTVEYEPAVLAGKDPRMAEEQANAGDREKPFAWPAEALWHGRIAAPDLSHAKELYRDDFASLETTWSIAKSAGSELGREKGTYFISADPGLVAGALLEDKTYANFACQVVGRVRAESTQWFLNYTSVTNDVTVRFHLNGLQSLEVSILNDGPPRVAKTIRHTAINQGEQFNKLLVVAVGNRFEIYANDVAICDPIVLDKMTPPGRFALGAVANENPVRAEFKSFTIWSAEGLPTLEERLASGVPYNRVPGPAKKKE